eukprot:353652-Chlamydomonas_euryale.AAC.2
MDIPKHFLTAAKGIEGRLTVDKMHHHFDLVSSAASPSPPSLACTRGVRAPHHAPVLCEPPHGHGA